MLLHSGTNPNPADATISFSMTINGVDQTANALTPSFNRLGPGAITDNMFGIISDPGADPAKCGVNTLTGVLPTSVGLNCGDLRFDPPSQMMTVPASPATDVLSSLIFQPSTFTGDFLPSADDHTGIDLKNRFIWSRTTATLTDGTPPDLTVTCSAATFTCVGSKQEQHEVIALLPGLAGTLTTPGSGEQNFDQTVDWTITNSSGNTFASPVINRTLQFNDPIRDANNNPRLQTGLISGSFAYQTSNTTTDPTLSTSTFPTVTIPLMRNSTDLCRGVSGTAGSCITIP